MGRFLVFLIIIAAALAGVWFFAPGGQEMLLGAKDKAMSMMPGAAPAESTDTVVIDVAPEESADDVLVEEVIVDEPDAMDELAPAEEPAAEPQH